MRVAWKSKVTSAYLCTNCYLWDNAVERERRWLARWPRVGAKPRCNCRSVCTGPPPQPLQHSEISEQGSELPSS